MKFNVLVALLGASTAIKVNQRESTNAGTTGVAPPLPPQAPPPSAAAIASKQA